MFIRGALKSLSLEIGDGNRMETEAAFLIQGFMTTISSKSNNHNKRSNQ